MINNHSSGIVKLNIVISLVIAFCAWLFVVYNYSPMKTVKYTDIPVRIVGEDELAFYGYEVWDVSVDKVDVTLKINRKSYNDISAENILATVNVGEAKSDKNIIKIEVTGPSDAFVEKTGVANATVTVKPITVVQAMDKK